MTSGSIVFFKDLRAIIVLLLISGVGVRRVKGHLQDEGLAIRDIPERKIKAGNY